MAFVCGEAVNGGAENAGHENEGPNAGLSYAHVFDLNNVCVFNIIRIAVQFYIDI